MNKIVNVYKIKYLQDMNNTPFALNSLVLLHSV